MALRKMKMGDLMEQQQARPNSPTKQTIVRSPTKERIEERPLPAPPSPSKLPSPARKPIIQLHKSGKRKSSAILIPSDHDNDEPDTSNTAVDSLPVQKNPKRAKTGATTAPTVPKRTASRTKKKTVTAKDVPAGVLSPRSHNSRALPRSPIKDKELPTAPVPAPAPASPVRQQQQQPRPLSPSKPQSPFKMAATAGMSAISAFAKRGYAAAGAAGAKLARPISREKDQPNITGLGTAIPVPTSPTGKMLPPPRPALATLTSTGVTAIPTLSPQRTASQASVRSNMSEQSNVSSTNGTVITKPTRGATLKKAIGAGAKSASAKKTTTTAIKTKQKIVVSGSTTSTVSPKATKKTATSTTTTAAAKKAATAAATRKAAATPAPSGRVLRKRN